MSEGSSAIEAAAKFVAGEDGAAARLLSQHTRNDHGDCAGCGGYRPVRWPCVLVHIAERAREINRQAAAATRATPEHR